MISVQPQVLRTDTKSRGVTGPVCDACRAMSSESIIFHPGLVICSACLKKALAALLADAGTAGALREALTAAITQAVAPALTAALEAAAREAAQAAAEQALAEVAKAVGVR